MVSLNNQNQTLGFQIVTTRFLGTKEAASFIIDTLKKLPKKYWPTKSEYYSSKNKGLFSFENTKDFVDKVPGTYLFGGYAKLYKVRDLFSIYVNWTRCPTTLTDDPTLVFNSISIYFDNGLDLLKNKKDFNEVESIWVELCKRFNAWYGQCHLFSNTERSNEYLGWGFGRCISRLHWKTYFGKEYNTKFDIRNLNLNDLCTIKRYFEGDFLLTINAAPEEVVTRTNTEREIIKLIGKNYFWDENDNRLDPKGEYMLPSLNYSEVIYESIK
ncbi:hypothetical protein PAECIP111891_05253 [Paenibacillus allorhizoplanae]|uniref:YubB ferredoxin-like domain-containing protein n=1 Tax=Paenibacillus allorhizoplanae TaxID=2905648 RepID=A0ABM9CQK9_9BACL|nr:hypothetical protein [Paenibacillus allorhizoplanae]CAH1221616.1 hypothetical protein PAECIP111891_05253 [Paenibacillus allorhizoplanae]